MMKTDSELQDQVLEELKWDPRVDHTHVGVTCDKGVVTLTGFVPSYAQKIAAERAARSVQGVRAIAQDIVVRFPSDAKTSDGEIAQRILDIFEWDVTVPHDKLTVKVDHGIVKLGGTVDWHFQREAAVKAAGKISGVRLVVNTIDIASHPSSLDIRDRIMAAFKRASALDASAIDVRVDGGTVQLDGRVRGWNERRIAENAAWSARGVTKVEDNIVLA
jgi:osmotically-inducible protein OsmY